MSINAMANAAAARRLDMAPVGIVPNGLEEIARAAATTPTSADLPPAPGQPPAAAAGQSASQIDTALHVLFGYIPTEILTLYVAVLAAIHQPEEVTGADWNAFWLFLIATPSWFGWCTGPRSKPPGRRCPWLRKPGPLGDVRRHRSLLRLGAGPAEYALCRVFVYSSALSGVIVLVTSTFLGLLAPSSNAAGPRERRVSHPWKIIKDSPFSGDEKIGSSPNRVGDCGGFFWFAPVFPSWREWVGAQGGIPPREGHPEAVVLSSGRRPKNFVARGIRDSVLGKGVRGRVLRGSPATAPEPRVFPPRLSSPGRDAPWAWAIVESSSFLPTRLGEDPKL